MTEWRTHILKKLEPGIHRLTLVSDPDGLLLDGKIQAELKKKAVEVLVFEDNVSFRYYYEAKYRNKWDAGENVEVIVLLRKAFEVSESLPYDLLKAGHKIAFSLTELFERLSYPVVEKIGSE